MVNVILNLVIDLEYVMKAASIGIFALGLTFSGAASAAPSAFQSKACTPGTIQNSTSSSLLPDNQKCNLYWVMPSTGGMTKLTSFQRSSNLGFCTNMKQLRGTTATIERRLGEMTQDYDALKPKIEKASRELSAAEKHYASVIANSRNSELISLGGELRSVDQKIDGIVKQMNTCTSNCEILQTEYERLLQLRDAIQAKYDALSDANGDLVLETARAEEAVRSAKNAKNRIQDDVDDALSRFTKLRSTLFAMYREYGELEGGFANVNYSFDTLQNMQKLSAAYPGFEFRVLPTSNARIFANIIGATDQASYLRQLPMILDYSINGNKMIPWGESKVIENSSLPNSIMGSFRMSTVGACTMAFANFLDSDDLTPSGTGLIQDACGILNLD